MSWTWEIRSGKLYDDAGALVAIGYSGGDQGQAPDGVNNPDCCHLSCVGPLPEGNYTISQIADDSGNPVDYGNKKAPVMRLNPDSTNEMYGRSGFLIHGDNSQLNRSASDGCIILPKTIREQIWASVDHSLHAVISVPDDFPE